MRATSPFDTIKDAVWCEIDFNRIELVILAWIAKVTKMREALLNGEDLHKKTSSLIFKKSIDVLTDEERQLGKRGNFAIVYGESPNSFAARYRYSLEEAQKFFAEYHKTYPEINIHAQQIVADVIAGKMIYNAFGRARSFPLTGNRGEDSHRFREAVNFGIQGTASDICLSSLVRLYESYLWAFPDAYNDLFLPINIIHDAIWFMLDRIRISNAVTLIYGEMMDRSSLPFDLDLPLQGSMKIGDSAGQYKEYKTLEDVYAEFGAPTITPIYIGGPAERLEAIRVGLRARTSELVS